MEKFGYCFITSITYCIPRDCDMPNLYCIRAEFGKYTDCFLKGGYVAIGWLLDDNLSSIQSKDEIKQLYINAYPEDKSNYVIGQQVGQIGRFLFDLKIGDYVITPDINPEKICWGIIENGDYYNKLDNKCQYPHRKKVKWNKESIQRNRFSVPFQNSIRSSLTIFSIEDKNDFFQVIGKNELVEEKEARIHQTTNEVILNKILELDAVEFEHLVTNLLTVLGFEARHTGKVGDGGVDATGELDIYGIAKIQLYVQVKRYKCGSRINKKDVKALRQNIPTGSQGAFITTADFQKEALDIAIEPGYPRIGTINGDQLVDILVEKWDELPLDLRERLGLKRSLVIG